MTSDELLTLAKETAPDLEWLAYEHVDGPAVRGRLGDYWQGFVVSGLLIDAARTDDGLRDAVRDEIERIAGELRAA